MIRLIFTEKFKILSKIHKKKRVIRRFNHSFSTSSGEESDMIVRICRDLGLKYQVDIFRFSREGSFRYVNPFSEGSIINARIKFSRYSTITVFSDPDSLMKELKEKYNYVILYNYGHLAIIK